MSRLIEEYDRRQVWLAILLTVIMVMSLSAVAITGLSSEGTDWVDSTGISPASPTEPISADQGSCDPKSCAANLSTQTGSNEAKATAEGDDIGSNATELLQDDPRGLWETVTERNWGYEAIGLETFHEEIDPDNRGEDVDIVIIDRGFDLEHPLYNDVEGGEPHRDYHVNVVNTWCPSLGCDIDDAENGHGTAVTGLVWQAAPNANYHLLDPTAWAFSRNALEDAWREAESIDPDIIVSSVGVPEDQEDGNDGTSDISQAANDAAAGDTVAIAAAGQNSPDDGLLCRTLGLWCEEREIDYPVVPSDAENVLSISQTFENRQDGTLSQFIGSDRNNVKYSLDNNPSLAAPGRGVSTLAPTDADTPRDGTMRASGTSLAAPQVAGIAALLAATHDGNEVEQALKSSGIVTDQYTGVETEIDGDGRVSILGAYDHLKQDVPKPDPTVSVTNRTIEEDGASFFINLENDGGSSSVDTNGIMINKDDISITEINTGSFDHCLAGTAIDGCEVEDDLSSDVVELYTDEDFASSGIIRAEFDGDPAEAGIEYRGWIYDDTSAVINPTLFDHQDNFEVRAAASYEPYITRYPNENTDGLPTAENPSDFTASDNPPYARAAYDESFDITDYETVFKSLSPVETSVTASPETWDLGAIGTESTHTTEIALENTGEISTDIDISTGAGLSVEDAPDELASGTQDSFDLTLEASDYSGGSVVVEYAGGTLSVPISTTIVDDEDLVDEESVNINDPDPCIWKVDVWGEDAGIGCGEPEDMYRKHIDDVSLDDEVIDGFESATLYVEFATDPNHDAQPDPLEVYVNDNKVASEESPPGGGEFETRSISLSESDLQAGDNTVRLEVSGTSRYEIGDNTEFHYSYFEEAELNLDFGAHPEEVEVGETFLLPVTVENEGGQVAEDVRFGITDFDGVTVEGWPASFPPEEERDLEPRELDTGYFEIKLKEETTTSGTIAVDREGAFFDEDESFTVEPPNDPPTIDSRGVSSDEVYPNDEVTYTATVTDPNDDDIDVTLDVYIPSEGSWDTIETTEISGSGTAEFSTAPFGENEIGEVSQFRFTYETEFGHSGEWGPFAGPAIEDPNPEGPSFRGWSYPTGIQPDQDIEVQVDISDSAGVDSAELTYTKPGETEESTEMVEDEGNWTATIPAPAQEAVGQQIEFFVTATDDHRYSKTSQSIPRYITIEELYDPCFKVDIIETNSPFETGETLEVTAEIENEGDTSDTQTVALDAGGLGNDSTSVSLSSGENTTETFAISTSFGDSGTYTATVESENDNDNTTVDIVTRLPSPIFFPIELDRNVSSAITAGDGFLYATFEIEDSDDMEVGKIDPSTEEVIETFDIPGGSGSGLTYNEGDLWTVDSHSDQVTRINSGTGDTEVVFQSAGDPTGVGFGGEALWIGSASSNYIYEYTTDGEEISSFYTGSETASIKSVAYHDDQIWVGDGNENIFVYKPTGDLVEQHSVNTSTQVGSGYGGILVADKERNIDQLFETGSDPALFNVTINESESTTQVTENETIVIEATVENTGEITGTQTITFDAGGLELNSTAVSLNGGEATTETVTLEVNDSLDGEELQVSSKDDSDVVELTVESDEEEDDEISGFTIVAAVIAMIIGGIYVRMSR